MKHTPGPDERGNYWFDCGCMINGLMQKRCSLHHAAPALLAEHKQWAQVFGIALTDVLQSDYRRINQLAQELSMEMVNGSPSIQSPAIAQAKGE